MSPTPQVLSCIPGFRAVWEPLALLLRRLQVLKVTAVQIVKFQAVGMVKVNKPIVNMLRRVEPYITWGYPNLKSVKELIYKRGYGKVRPAPKLCLYPDSYVLLSCPCRCFYAAFRAFSNARGGPFTICIGK